MRPITVLIFALLVFLIDLGSATTALSHGALAICTNGRFTIAVGAAKDKPTPEVARTAARAAFVPNTVWSCEAPDRFVSFSNSCVAVVSRGAPMDSAPIEEKHFWVRSASSEQEAMADALAACRSPTWTNCTLNEVVCDGTPSPSVTPDRPALPDTASQSPSLPDDQPGRPKFSVESVVKEIPADPPFTVTNGLIQSASNDVRQFIGRYDLHWVALIASTGAICIFVGTQLYSLIRTGRRRLRDIVFSASVSVLAVLAMTTMWFVGSYTSTRLVAFGSTLSLAGKLLLASSVIGMVLLAIPYSFWRAIGKLFNYRPQARTATVEEPSAPPSTSSFEETRGDSPSHDKRTGNVVSMVQPQAPEINVSGDASPRQPIVLRLKRSQKPAMTGMIYMLDARIDLSAEVQSMITTHKLGNRVIYESEARQRHAENVRGHLDNSRSNTPIFAPAGDQAKGLGRTLWGLARAGVSAARASLALRITVSSLMAGVHVECKSMEELLEAESAIREAKVNLESQIEALRSFDGSEEVI